MIDDGRGLGWKRDLPDPRDFKFAASRETRAAAPPSADLRPLIPYWLDQGKLSSCTANSEAYQIDALRATLGLPPLRPSRLYQYYNTRVLEGTPNDDSGASLRNTIQAVVKWGACPENMWDYDITQFRDKPVQVCYDFGSASQVIEYLRVDQSLAELTGAIAEGYPVIYGMLIFPQFEHLASHGMVAMPGLSDRPIGGHSGLLVHYWTDDRGEVWFTDKNTWGEDWGNGGYGHLPAGYILNKQLCDDFWIIRSIEVETTPPTPTPLDPWTIYYVGPGIAAAMRARGDVPASYEWYPLDESGQSRGFSMAYGASGAEYIWIVSLGRVVVK